MKRRLALKSEYLAPLSSDELSFVNAAGVTTECTGYYLTIDRPCPSVQECIATVLTVQKPCPTLDGCFTGTTTTS